MLNLDPVEQEQTPCHHQLLVSGHSLNSQQLFLNCGDVITPVFFGGRLLALNKKSGGIRRIAIGFTLSRLASKCANSFSAPT